MLVLAFGLQLFWLGYYVDDWGILDAYHTKGIEGLRLYGFWGNRPLVFWIWWLGFQVNGLTPVFWQIWTFLWRFLSVVGYWLVLRGIWPDHKTQVLAATLLFSVYPIFLQQSTALTYSFHWICFFLFFISLYFTVLSIRIPGKFGLFTILAFLTMVIELFSQEFFVGLELLRPVLIGYLLWGSMPSLKIRLRKVLLNWLPYALVLVLYLVWRLFLMPTPGSDRNTPEILLGVFQTPLSTIPGLLETVIRDMFNGVVSTWSKTMQANVLFSFSPLASVVALGLVVLTSGGLFFFFYRNFRYQESEAPSPSPWYRPAIFIGLFAMLLGFAPGWAIGQEITITTSMYNDRFGLAAMVGAALVVTALVDWIIQKQKYQLGIYCLLIGLAVGLQFRTATTYRWSWEEQVRTYWELKWRAPQIATPTAFFAESALFSYMGGGANAAAFKQMYAFSQGTPNAEFTYYDLYKVDPNPFVSGLRSSGAQDNNLVIQSFPEDSQCVWVLSMADFHNPSLTAKVKATLPLSNLAIIKDGDSTLPADIFGPEPAPFWCYYYEKASLAAQFGRWDEVMRLWKEADSKGFFPRVEPEYLPFVEGAAMTGDWQLARDLSKKALHPVEQMNDYLCTVWQRVFQNAQPSTDLDFTREWVKGEFNCSAFIK